MARFFSPKCHADLKRFFFKKKNKKQSSQKSYRPTAGLATLSAEELPEKRQTDRERDRALARAREKTETRIFVFFAKILFKFGSSEKGL